MSDKELYQQKMQAKLDEWRADIDKLKAKASGASADAQLEFKKHIKTLEGKFEEGKEKLSKFADASEEAWETMKEGIESAWDSLKSAVSDVADKFKN